MSSDQPSGCPGPDIPRPQDTKRWREQLRDKGVYHALLEFRDQIHRQVFETSNGIEAVSTADDPEVVQLLHAHMTSMDKRMRRGDGLRTWDPLFAALFDQAGRIDTQFELTPCGLRVRTSGRDPDTVALIKAHSQVIGCFLLSGQAAFARPYAVPGTAVSPSAESQR